MWNLGFQNPGNAFRIPTVPFLGTLWSWDPSFGIGTHSSPGPVFCWSGSNSPPDTASRTRTRPPPSSSSCQSGWIPSLNEKGLLVVQFLLIFFLALTWHTSPSSWRKTVFVVRRVTGAGAHLQREIWPNEFECS